MTEVPRRPVPTPAGRAKTVALTHAALSGQGQTRAARPVTNNARQAQVYQPPAAVPVVIGQAGATAVSIVGTSSIAGSSTIAGDGAVAVGNLTTATGVNSVAVGRDGTASGDYSVRVGFAGSAGGTESVSIGEGTTGSGNDSTAVGTQAAATAANSTAIGGHTTASGAGSVAIGYDSVGNGAVAIGDDDFVLGTTIHNVSVPGLFGVHGATPVAQSATPTTLADVIAILQAHGFCA